MTNPKPSFSRGRKWSISLSVVLSTLTLFALMLMLNYLASRHYWRLPLAADTQTEISPLTRRVLSGVTNQVKAIVFFDKQEPVFDSVWGLLKEYRFACPKLTVEAVDYIADPGAAEIARAKYKLSFSSEKDKDVVIFDCQGRTRIVNVGELSELDMQPLMSGKSQEVKRTHFKGEMMFTSAILGVSNPRQIRACYVQGHGEHDLDSDHKLMGYSKFNELLRDNNIQVQPLRLDGPNEVPDCQLMIIAGPKTPFLPEELARVEQYLKQGGRLWVLFNYEAVEKPTGLEQMLENWGVEVGRNAVLDPEHTVSRYDVVVSQFGGHAVSKPLVQSHLYMLLPRSVAKMKTTGSDAPQVEVLATTGEKGQVITDIRKGELHPSPRDYVGAVPVMAAVEKGGLRGVSADRGATRLVVVGDSVFLGNETIDKLANRQFAHLALNWLVARNELLGELAPRRIKEYKLMVTKSQMTNLRWGLLAGMPGSVLLVGGLVWFRRRH